MYWLAIAIAIDACIASELARVDACVSYSFKFRIPQRAFGHDSGPISIGTKMPTISSGKD